MIATILGAGLLLAPDILGFGMVQYFPGQYYDAKGQPALRHRVLSAWPGVTGLEELWRSGELDEAQRVTLLLGGAAYHDPDLLPVYMEAITSPAKRVRLAASYGYRDLLADRRPSVSGGVSDEASQALQREMGAVFETLREHTLVALWLNSLLSTEGKELPEWRGVVLKRPRPDYFKALLAIAGSEDLELVLRAYRISDDWRIRVQLMRLIEGLALQRFLVIPKGERTGWGTKNYDEALEALDHWIRHRIDNRCRTDFEVLLATSFAEKGVRQFRLGSPEAFDAWQRVVLKGEPVWWPEAARRLYNHGGPPIPLSLIVPDSEENKKKHDALLKWYELRR